MTKHRRFSDDELRAIRDRVSILSLLAADALRPCGDQLRGRCPLPDHDDRNPSFYVSMRKRRFYCHGCKRGGDVIELHRQLYGSSFPDAVRELQDRAGVQREDTQLARTVRTAKTPRTRLLKPAHRELLKEVATRYREAAVGEQALIRYLEGRGFNRKDAVGLGFAPAQGIKLVHETGDRREMLCDLGLLDHRGGRLFERLHNSVVFAVTDWAGGVQGFVGRRIIGEPRYLNTRFSKRQLPLGLAEARDQILKTREIVFVEGPFDWLALRALGENSALALLGSTLHPEVAALLRSIGVEAATLALDRDKAGQIGTEEAALELRKLGIDLKQAQDWTYVHDPGELPRGGSRAFGEFAASGKGQGGSISGKPRSKDSISQAFSNLGDHSVTATETH